MSCEPLPASFARLPVYGLTFLVSCGASLASFMTRYMTRRVRGREYMNFESESKPLCAFDTNRHTIEILQEIWAAPTPALTWRGPRSDFGDSSVARSRSFSGSSAPPDPWRFGPLPQPGRRLRAAQTLEGDEGAIGLGLAGGRPCRRRPAPLPGSPGGGQASGRSVNGPVINSKDCFNYWT